MEYNKNLCLADSDIFPSLPGDMQSQRNYAEKATAHPPSPLEGLKSDLEGSGVGVVWPFAIFSYSILFAPSLPSGHVEQFITEG